jgi:hypothetical protein
MSCSERISLKGIKVSPELLLIRLAAGPQGVQAGSTLLRLLAGQRINLPFVCMDGGRDSASLLTVEMNRAQAVTPFLCRPEISSAAPERLAHTVLVSLYPHATRLDLLGSLLDLAGSEAVPIHGLASSLGALGFLTEYGQVARVLGLLENTYDLPANRSPYRAEFMVKQSTLTRPDDDGEPGGER